MWYRNNELVLALIIIIIIIIKRRLTRRSNMASHYNARLGQGKIWCSSSVVFAGNAILRLRNDLYCVGWGVKLYSLTHLYYARARPRRQFISISRPYPVAKAIFTFPICDLSIDSVSKVSKCLSVGLQCQTPSKRRTNGQRDVSLAAGRRVAATSTRRGCCLSSASYPFIYGWQTQPYNTIKITRNS